jgi:hypothetical protein
MRTAYTDFSKSVGLLTRNERTQAYGFDRSISAKAVWAVKNYEKELDKYKQVRYNDDGTVVVTDDLTKTDRNTMPNKYKPNAVVDVQSGNEKSFTIKRYYYDENGIVVKRVDNNNHGNPKQHPFGEHGEHGHNYEDVKGKWTSGKSRPLTTDEINENGDIL